MQFEIAGCMPLLVAVADSSEITFASRRGRAIYDDRPTFYVPCMDHSISLALRDGSAASQPTNRLSIEIKNAPGPKAHRFPNPGQAAVP